MIILVVITFVFIALYFYELGRTNAVKDMYNNKDISDEIRLKYLNRFRDKL